jgi:site-specific DNA-cytosine methylase
MSTRSRRLLSETEQAGHGDDEESHQPAIRVSPENSPEDRGEDQEGAGEHDLSPEIVRRLSRQFGIPETMLVKAAEADESESLTERLTMERAEEKEEFRDAEELEDGESEEDQEKPKNTSKGARRFEEMETLLGEIDQYFGLESGSGDPVSALEILMGRVLVNIAQPELGKVKGGIRVRSLDQLVTEVERVMGSDVERITKSAAKGGKNLVKAVKEFDRKVAAAMQMRPMLVTAVTLRLWMESGDKRVRQMCMDACQAMCRTDPEEWRELGKQLAEGVMDEELLTDQSVEGLKGFNALSPGGEKYSDDLDAAWTKLMLFSAVYLAYEPEVPISEEEALGKWCVMRGGEQHHLNMRKGEKVSMMHARHRSSERELRADLARCKAQSLFPTETARVRNFCLAVSSELRRELYEDLREEGTGREELTVKEVLKRLGEIEKRQSMVYWEPKNRALDRRPPAPRKEVRFDKAEGGNRTGEGRRTTHKPARTGEARQGQERLSFSSNENRAMENYAKAKGLRKEDVTLEMVQKLGVAHWKAGEEPVKIPTPKAQPSVSCIGAKAKSWKKKYGVRTKGPRVFCIQAEERGRNLQGTEHRELREAAVRRRVEDGAEEWENRQEKWEAACARAVEGAMIPWELDDSVSVAYSPLPEWMEIVHRESLNPEETNGGAPGEPDGGAPERTDSGPTSEQKNLKVRKHLEKWGSAHSQGQAQNGGNESQPEVVVFHLEMTGEDMGQLGIEDEESSESSEHSINSPRMGDREGLCQCMAGHGSHGCQVYLEPERGDVDYCPGCRVRPGIADWGDLDEQVRQAAVDGEIRMCWCDCDECDQWRWMTACHDRPTDEPHPIRIEPCTCGRGTNTNETMGQQCREMVALHLPRESGELARERRRDRLWTAKCSKCSEHLGRDQCECECDGCGGEDPDEGFAEGVEMERREMVTANGEDWEHLSEDAAPAEKLRRLAQLRGSAWMAAVVSSWRRNIREREAESEVVATGGRGVGNTTEEGVRLMKAAFSSVPESQAMMWERREAVRARCAKAGAINAQEWRRCKCGGEGAEGQCREMWTIAAAGYEERELCRECEVNCGGNCECECLCEPCVRRREDLIYDKEEEEEAPRTDSERDQQGGTLKRLRGIHAVIAGAEGTLEGDGESESEEATSGESEDESLEEEDEEFESVLGFVVQVGGGNGGEEVPMVAGDDSFAETSVIRRSRVDSAWTVIDSGSRTVVGAGGEGTLGERVKVPVRMRSGAEGIMLQCRVMNDEECPCGVDILLGTRARRRMGSVDDVANSRIVMRALGLVINKEPVQLVRARMEAKPVRVLDCCAGLSGAYHVLRDLGMRIDTWHAVEADETLRKVVALNIPFITQVSERMEGFTVEEEYDFVFAGPPCQPWSRCNSRAKGFEDERARVFEECCRVKNEARMINPHCRFMFETTDVARHLKGDRDKQDELVGEKFRLINARDLGAPQSRPRRIATDIIGEGEEEGKEPVDPNLVLGRLGASVEARVTPCVVAAGSNTHTVIRVRDEETGCNRPASLDEMEALMGYPVGMRNAGGSVQMTYEKQASAIGNQFHYELVRGVMAEVDPGSEMMRESYRSLMSVSRPAGAATPIEEWSEGVDDEELEAWMLKKLQGYELPRLQLRLKGDETVPYQVPVRSRYQTPTKLREATLHALKKKLDAGWLKLVPYDSEAWISMMFVKAKGRIDPESGLEAVRFLSDLRPVNSALDWPAHWMDKCPSIEGVRLDVPWWACWFAEEDVSDAYESMKLKEHLKNMLCCAPPIPIGPDTFSDEELRRWLTEEEIAELKGQESWLLRWEGVPQGLAPAAPFWNIHIYDAFNRLFREEWHQWWVVYVDDVLTYGRTEQQTKVRQRMLSMALRLLGKTVSSKIDRTVKQEGNIVGLKFIPGGVVVCDETVAAVRVALKEEIKTAKQARRLVGILIYASAAFEWDADDMTFWPRMMSPMHESYSGHSFRWSEEAVAAARKLEERVAQCKRATCRPLDMISDGWRIVIKSDGSDLGVGACLLLVKAGRDGEVTPEMMLDTERVRLIATYCKVLSAGERKWLTFEIEAFGMYKALRRWGSFLMQAGVRGWVAPPLLWMDSSTATAQWTGVGIPGVIDHASAKAQRFQGWAEKIQYVQWMDLDMKWIPGHANDFADLLSRCADLIKKSAKELDGLPKVFPMMRMKYHRDGLVGEQGPGTHGAPEGFEAVHLALSEEDWEEVTRAFLADNDKVQGVSVSDLFRAVTMDGEGVSAETMIRIRPWVGRRYFEIAPPGAGGRKMMYVPRSQTRTHWAEEDETRVLVLYIPSGADVVLTELREVRKLEEKEEFEVTDLRRSLLMICHDLNNHPGIGETVSAVKKMAYWATIVEGKDSCRRHWEMCSFCLEQLRIVQHEGRGCETAGRFRVVQADHKILTDGEAELTGCVGVLSLVDVATRMTVYAAVHSGSDGDGDCELDADSLDPVLRDPGDADN